MSEAIPSTLIMAALLLLTSVTFFSVVNLWSEHNGLISQVTALQEQRLETSLEISNVALGEDVCPNYSGPFDAAVENNGATDFTDLDQMDVFLEYVDGSDNEVSSRLDRGPDWSLSGLTPDTRNPNQWDSGETGTVSFGVAPGLKPGTSGVLLLASPQGVTDAGYFTCPAECSGETGFLSPSAEAADTGGNGDGFETTPTGAFADGGGAASSVTLLVNGDNHRFYNYGFFLVGSCNIEGIEVRIDWWLLDTLGDNSMAVDLSWDGGNTWSASRSDSAETTSEHTAILGGSTDTWGRTWSPSDFDDANFRARVTTNRTLPQTHFLDWVAVNVHYSPP